MPYKKCLLNVTLSISLNSQFKKLFVYIDVNPEFSLNAKSFT